MSKIKAIVMDVDGTLTNGKKQITEKTKEVLLKAQSKGIKLILASGRPTTGLIGFAKELEMDKNNGLLVSFNGSKVVDCETFEELFNEPMSIEEGKAVLEHMKKFEVRPMVDKGEYMLVNNVFDNKIYARNGQEINIIEYESRGGNYKLCEIDDLAEYIDYPLNKILTAGQPDYLKEHYREMMEPFKDKLSCMFTADFYFEFTAKGIDKAKALETVLKPMGYLDLLLIVAVLFSCILSFITSIYKAQGTLFSSKDYDLLMALPIRNSTILTSKILSLMSINYIGTALVIVPASIVYFIYNGSLSWIFFIILIIGLVFIGLTFLGIIIKKHIKLMMFIV